MKLRSENNDRYTGPALHSEKGVVLLVMLTILILGSSYLLVDRLNPQTMNSRQNQQTTAQLNVIQDALLGYAVANGRLPCPDTDNDGLQNGPNCNAVEGGVPWSDLGIPSKDAWGHSIRYRADDAFTLATPISSNTSSNLRIETLTGTLLSLTNPNAPTAILFSCGMDGMPNDNNDADGGINGSANCTNPGAANNVYIMDSLQANFDDLFIWISKTQLQSQMSVAGNWP